MFAMNLGKLDINEAELKAYIYQQLNDIQPYIGEEPVAIKMAYSENGEYTVKMHYSHNAGDVEAESTGNDIYNAISRAKDAFIKSVTTLDTAYEMENEDTFQSPVTSHVEKKTIH